MIWLHRLVYASNLQVNPDVRNAKKLEFANTDRGTAIEGIRISFSSLLDHLHFACFVDSLQTGNLRHYSDSTCLDLRLHSRILLLQHLLPDAVEKAVGVAQVTVARST